ncbi:MAG: hypothetical protein M1820_006288 [Bogoriella megaspora]|nr:MAG: hypothetical protein M1820_006288 [Bogoriella megaspora]
MTSTGRGGAGNILSSSDVQSLNSQASNDLEAAQQSAEDYTSNRDALGPTRTSAPSYQTTGRGGAGNFYNPSDPNQPNSFSNANMPVIPSAGLPNQETTAEPLAAQGDPTTSAPGTTQAEDRKSSSQVPESHFPSYVGRGGAGNWMGSRIGEQAARNEEAKMERLKEEVMRGVERDVEMGLSKPEEVHLGEGKLGVRDVRDGS